jgi:enoyl-CoA hydratase/carnithine racemase
MVLSVHRHDDVWELQLDRPPANALHPELMVPLREQLALAYGQARAVVLSGRPGMFCAGLDVPALLTMAPDQAQVLMREFLGLSADLLESPIPVIAALTGHAPAGGTMLAIFCDARIMARGSYKLGMREVVVGLSVPPAAYHALCELVGTRQARLLCLEGRFVEAQEAFEIGLVDALEDMDQVVAQAVAWARRWTAMPPKAFCATRTMMRQSLVAKAAELRDAGASHAGLFHGEETRTAMLQLVNSLRKST